MPRIAVKRLSPKAHLPVYQTPGAAGADVCACLDGLARLAPGERRAIPTGLSLEIPPGFEVQVRPRSGLALKHGITLPNAPGTIDSDYRGELQVILLNSGSEPYEIKDGDRIAQLVVAPVIQASFEEKDELSATTRGSGGFGSTGYGRQPKS